MAAVTKIATGAAQAAGSPFNGSWTNEQNARVATSDLTAAGSNTYATCAPGKNQEFASVWPFVFSSADVPDGASIDGVSVKVQWKVSTTSSVATLRSTCFADQAQTVPLSASPGVNRTSEPTVDTDDSYALSEIPTVQQLRDGLWVRVQAMRGNTNTAFTGSLDYIQVTVTYTESANQTAQPAGHASTGSYGAVTADPGAVARTVAGRASAGSYGLTAAVPGAVSRTVAGRASVAGYGAVVARTVELVQVEGHGSQAAYGAVTAVPGATVVAVSGRASVGAYGAAGVARRVFFVLRGADGQPVASEEVQYAVLAHDGGDPAGAAWMSREAKGTVTTGADGTFEVPYSGALGYGDWVYVVVFHGSESLAAADRLR